MKWNCFTSILWRLKINNGFIEKNYHGKVKSIKYDFHYDDSCNLTLRKDTYITKVNKEKFLEYNNKKRMGERCS